MGHADKSQKQNSGDSLSRVDELWSARLGLQLSNNCSYNSFDYKSVRFSKSKQPASFDETTFFTLSKS